jgi:hypothetical protein
MTDAILELLAEEGMSDEVELGSYLAALRAEATSVHPMPSAAVSELMPLRRTRTSRSPLAGRRRIVTGLIVLGSLGVGVGAAAASPDVRAASQQFAQSVIGTIGSIVAPSSHQHAPHQPSPPLPSNAGAPTHPTKTNHPGNAGNGIGDLRNHGEGVPESRDLESPSAHPDPTHSSAAPSHRP